MKQNESDHTRITREGRKIVLESDFLRCEIEPDLGGKIRTFESKRSGRNFFLKDSRTTFSGPGYSDHDISGCDECFPTVIGCRGLRGSGRGLDMGDHGWLWQRPWTTNVRDGSVEMACDLTGLQCRFGRTIRWQSPRTLLLEYAIENHGCEDFDYLYSAHPMLCGSDQTEIILPPEMAAAWVTVAINVPGLRGQSWMNWPPPAKTTLSEPFDARRGSVVKLYSPALKHGWAAIRHKDIGEQLEVEFDTERLPHLGVLVSQGYDTTSDGHWRKIVFLGLEPTSGMGDDIGQCQTNGTISTLPAGEKVEFWIKLSLRDGKE